MTKIAGWKLHGESSCRDLIAGLLPASGMHFLIAPNEDERRAIVADLAVSIAAGPMASEVVQESKKSDGWRLASGFLGLATGEPCGVGIVGAAKQSDIAAAAAWRAIKSPLSIAVSTASKSDIVSARLHDLRGEMNVGLVIVSADWTRGVDEVRRIMNFGNGSWVVLVVSATEPPANLVKGEARVLRVENGSLTLSHPSTATPWSAPLALEPIKIGAEKAYGVRPSAEAVSEPEFAPAAPEAHQGVPEPVYAGVVVYAAGGGTFGLSLEEISSWPADTKFRSTPEALVEAVREIGGAAKIVVALVEGSKADIGMESRRVRTSLEMAHLAGVCSVEVVRRKLRDVRELEGAA